jgi:hypothetical protein
MLDEKDPNTDFRKLVILQGREGLQPTLRVVHAVPQSSVRLVDVYLDNATTPRTVGMHYRSATPLYQPAVDSTTIRFTPYQLPPAQAFLTSGIPLNTDTGYVTILTQFRNGSITSYNLTRYLQMPPTGATNTRVRVTNATDFFGDPSEPALNLSFVMTPEGASPIQIDMLGFEKTTEWYEIPAGPVGIKAYRSGVAAPVFEGTYTVDPMKDYTFIALGTDASLSIDVLDQTLFGEQKPLGSFGPQETGVRTGAELAVAQLLTSPNPFAGSASLSFTTSHAGHVMVELYDALGQITRRPVDDWRAQGTHSARIDADGLPAGRYHVVLRVDERIEAMGEVVVIR